MSRWTIKQLNEADNLTFAMSILSERGKDLNPHTPLSQKLQRSGGIHRFRHSEATWT